jgi:spermidine synthase
MPPDDDATADVRDELPWYTETLHEGFRTSFQVRRVLFDDETEHQRLVVAESVAFGKLVMLDGVTQLTTADEHIYHEMLSHVPILAHGAVRQVLIVGGGDGGMIEEVFKHPSVEHVTMAELDAGVIELARTQLPELSNSAFDDPRLEIRLGDGRETVATAEGGAYDLIIVDSTDPIGPGESLFTPTFYAECRRVLRPGGVIVTQNGVPFFQAGELASTMRAFGSLLADATCYIAAVPTYVGGFMAFGWGTDDVAVRQTALSTIEERFVAAHLDTRYYTPEIHLASFALPRALRDLGAAAVHDGREARPG